MAMSEKKNKSAAHWVMIIFISFAMGMFANGLVFYLILMFGKIDGDAWVEWYFGGDHHYFIGISLLLAVLFMPLVNKIPNRLE
jgi:hypothetical protein